MDGRIGVALVIVVAVMWGVRLFPRFTISRIALSWFGPTPRKEETWSKYQLRWAIYSFDWLAQITGLLAVLMGIVWFFPKVEQHHLFMLFFFALPLAWGMAALALLAFLLKATKAAYLGPNPVWDGPEWKGIDV